MFQRDLPSESDIDERERSERLDEGREILHRGDEGFGERVPQTLEEARYRYKAHPNRYIYFANDILGIRVSQTQREILRALAEHERLIIVSGNGVGKSFSVGVGILGYLYTNVDSFVVGTSGSYSQFVDGMWRAMIADMFDPAQERWGLPGKATWGNQPTLEITKNWYAKIVSPSKPKGLEGRHAETGMVVIEEADDKDITHEHLSSARSTVTSSEDRMVVVANPPTDESDVVADLLDNPNYHRIQFSSFESHNALVDIGELDEERIPGLVDLHTIKEDWVEYNAEPWPGWDAAKYAHEERSDLSVNWYRRRAGVIPKDDAVHHRPFRIREVDRALSRDRPPREEWGRPLAISVDVARKGGDETVVTTLYHDTMTQKSWSHTDHEQNFNKVDAIYRDLPRSPQYVVVDAVGEGSALADRLRTHFGAIRFKSGTKARDPKEFYNCWTEALFHFGQRLDEMCLKGCNRDLKEEMQTAARVIEFEEYAMKSGDVLKATPKTVVKERHGNSPDYLDSAVMAAWVVDAGGRRLPLTW